MKTIAIVSQKGGAGKTTLALHVATAAEAAGLPAAIIDLDPQASAAGWGDSRQGEAPVVVALPHTRLPQGLQAATDGGAELVVIDTAPHSEAAAMAATRSADLVLIPCRPSAFDLAAIKTTASLVKMRGKPAFVIFTAGSPTAPRMYEEATQLVQDYGLDACPHRVADRAAFRHAAAEGKTAMEIEPDGKAADEVRQLYKWTCEHVNMQASTKKRRVSA